MSCRKLMPKGDSSNKVSCDRSNAFPLNKSTATDEEGQSDMEADVEVDATPWPVNYRPSATEPVKGG